MVRGDVETILEPASLSALEKLGDWLILYFIVKNVDLLTVNQVKMRQNLDHIIVFDRIIQTYALPLEQITLE